MSVINNSINVFNEPLMICGTSPMTGAYRDGCCNTGMNDLTMDYPPSGFKGLVEGDKWCLCVSRWIEAYQANIAPPIILKSTHIKTLEYISLDELMKFHYKPLTND
jgi:uncharacterized protein (DUF2237 family)